MWDLFCVDRSVFCNTFLVLCSAGGLVCDVGQSDMTSVWLHWLSVFVCVSAWFAFGVYWFKRYVCVFRVERDSSFFEGTRLATFPIVVMGFSALIHSQQLCAVVESIEFDRDIFRVSLNHKILCSFFFLSLRKRLQNIKFTRWIPELLLISIKYRFHFLIKKIQNASSSIYIIHLSLFKHETSKKCTSTRHFSSLKTVVQQLEQFVFSVQYSSMESSSSTEIVRWNDMFY